MKVSLCHAPFSLPHFGGVEARRAKPAHAFTLVETVLAIGVAAFALISLMALLPAGLATFRTAIDTSVGAQIFQRVVTDVEQTDFDLLLAGAEKTEGEFYALPTRYFDDQGNEVVVASSGAPSAAEALRILYWARVRGALPGPANAAAQGDRFTSLPAPPGQTRFSPRDSTFLTVQIVSNPGNRTLSIDERLLWRAEEAEKQGMAIASYSAIVTRNGSSRKKP